MPQCIFCEEFGSEDLSEDCKLCPECGNPQFSGMMFDEKRKEEADKLEEKGDLMGTWNILFDEWKSHTDRDYYDEEMAVKISQWIESFFQRRPSLIDQRIDFILCQMYNLHYHGGHNEALDMFNRGLKITKDNRRLDLEIKLLQEHGSIQSQRYGGIENIPNYLEYYTYLSKLLEENKS